MPRDEVGTLSPDRARGPGSGMARRASPGGWGPATPEPRVHRRLSTDPDGALIGPNAVLQLVPVLDDALGPAGRRALLARAGVTIAAGDRMIPEADAACAHQRVRAELGPRAAGLAARAGRLTGEYILAHRIPAPARTLLRTLPPSPAARLLSKAIAQHAWTFVGSGRLSVDSPYQFTLAANPVIAGEASDTPLCHWHAAVFETLYRRLVHPNATCRELACAATGAPACTFRVTF